MSAPLPPSIRPVQVRIFVAKDGRGHVILNKDAVAILKERNLITQGYLYLDFSGTAMVLKQTRSAEIPLSGSEAKQ